MTKRKGKIAVPTIKEGEIQVFATKWKEPGEGSTYWNLEVSIIQTVDGKETKLLSHNEQTQEEPQIEGFDFT